MQTYTTMYTVLKTQLEFRIKALIIFFIIGLVLSGITAFPIETQLEFVMNYIHYFPQIMQLWLTQIYFAVKTTNAQFPFLSYGTDWLAFSHLVIATAFIGPLRDPVKNIWVIELGMIACIMVFPLAFIAGAVRGVPIYWTLIDCSFGLLGIIPLYICRRYITQLEALVNTNHSLL